MYIYDHISLIFSYIEKYLKNLALKIKTHVFVQYLFPPKKIMPFKMCNVL